MLLALTLPATAAAQEPMRAGAFRAMPAQRIADALLPAGHAPIAGVVFERMGEPRPPAPFVATIRSLRFYSISTPVSADFCVQQEIRAEITPMPEADDALLDGPPRLLRETGIRRLYRYRTPGAACDGTRPHFSVYGMPVAQGLDAFRALVGAVRQAETRARKPLSFKMSCDGRTCGSPRTMLHNLSYGEVVSLEPAPDGEPAGRDRFSRLQHRSGGSAIRFGLPLSGMNKTDIGIILFRGRIEHLAVEESSVVF